MATAAHRIRVWSSADFDDLIDAARKHRPFEIAGVQASLWWEAFLRLSYDTAMRVDDLLALEFGNLAEDGTLDAFCRKTGVMRAYELHPETVVAIRRAALPARRLVLPWPYSTPLLLYRQFRKTLRCTNSAPEGGAA